MIFQILAMLLKVLFMLLTLFNINTTCFTSRWWPEDELSLYFDVHGAFGDLSPFLVVPVGP